MVCADGTLRTGRGVHREEEKSNELKIPYTGGENNSSNAGNIDIGSIMSGNGSTDTVYGQLDEASKQQITSANGKSSITISK